MNHQGHLPTQDSIRIISFEMFDTGSYNPMYARPYQLSINNGQLQTMIDRVASNPGSTVSPELFSGLASSVLQPSRERGHQINIYNGWSQTRIRFVLVVEHISMQNGSAYYTFQGFTDKQDASIGGHLDPDMIFVINSFVRSVTREVATPQGMVLDQVIVESAQILNGQIIHDPQVCNSFGMRPMDISMGIQNHYLQAGYQSMNESMIPTQIMLNNEPAISKRKNGMAAHYLSNVVTNHATANELIGFGQGEQDIHARMYNMSHEGAPSENVFIRRLSQVRNIPGSVMFSMANLRSIDRNVDALAVYRPLRGVARANLSTTQNVATWHGSDNETLWAQVLAVAVPSIMLELLMGEVQFSATNDAMGGLIDVRLSPKTKFFVKGDMSRNAEMFKNRIVTEVLRDISMMNLLFYINMHCNVYNDTIIDIKIGNGEMARFVTPSFADGCYAPTFTSNQTQYHEFINEFETVLKQLPGNGVDVKPGSFSVAVNAGI